MKDQHVNHTVRLSVRDEYKTKLTQLSKTLPDGLQSVIKSVLQSLGGIIQLLPWTLTHDDLSDMNILVDLDTGRPTGIVDWADAVVRPFGVALWGLESVLGRNVPAGWVWLSNEHPRYRKLFCDTFRKAVGGLTTKQCGNIERARILGLLLRYGFTWENETKTMVPTHNTQLLVTFLERKFNETGLDTDTGGLIDDFRFAICLKSGVRGS